MNSAGTVIENGQAFRGYITDFGAGNVAVDSEWWTTNGGGFGDVGTQFIMDGSWVKLREITLTYDFESDVVDRLGLDNLSLAVSGRNLFTWTDIEGFDPENPDHLLVSAHNGNDKLGLWSFDPKEKKFK